MPKWAATSNETRDRELPESLISKPEAARDVLLVEADPVQQETLVNLLEKLQCKVDVVPNGQEAIEAATKTNYDIIFMDTQLPILNGFEATRALRKLSPTVPIVAISATGAQGTDERCRAAGMQEYIHQPIALGELERVIGTWSRVRPQKQETHVDTILNEAQSKTKQRALDKSELSDLIGELVRHFKLMIPPLIKTLTGTPASAGTRGTLRQIQAISLTLGADEMVRICRTLQQAVEAKAASEWQAQIARLEREFRSACDNLEGQWTAVA